MKIAINRSHQNKMPDPLPSGWWAAYNGAFENENIDASDVLMFARMGWAYCAQHDGYRKADLFLCGGHVDLDFDNGSKTIWQLADDPFIRDNAAFLYETASSTLDHPKVRVFFELDRPITSAQKYKLLRDALLARYPAADPAHRDICRFAFGSRDCNYIWLGNVLTLETAAAALVRPFQRDTQATIKVKKQKRIKAQPTIATGTRKDVPAKFLAGRLACMLNDVVAAPDGEKYTTLRAAAVKLGGYVASEYYDYQKVRAALQKAIRDNGRAENLDVADKCIDDALAYGQGQPLEVARA